MHLSSYSILRSLWEKHGGYYLLSFSQGCLKTILKGEGGKNPILRCPLASWHVWSEQGLDSLTVQACWLSEVWCGSHLACLYVPQIIHWDGGISAGRAHTEARTGLPNGCAQIRILFRNCGKWKLSGTSNLCGTDGEWKGHLGECDTDAWPAACF